jgi:ABC-type spermidine/putrescine transport system permease subunit II
MWTPLGYGGKLCKGASAVADFIQSGRVADLVILCLVLEAAALSLYRWRTGRGLSTVATMLLVLPGMMLALALRAALTGVPWMWIGISLGAALLAHLADLHWRISTANA